MKSRRMRLASLLAVVPLTLSAAQLPVPVAAEPRIRLVDYDPDNVVELRAYYGYEIHTVFGEGEVIQDVVLGDTDAWTEHHHGNHLYFKPVEDDATTNMSVLTNRHSYEFSLAASEPPKHLKPQQAAFVVAYRYPGDDARAKALADSQEQERLDIAAQLAAVRNAHPRNLDYYAEGSADVIPNKAWDDGAFTYLQFLGGREMPAVFVVNADRSESLVNSHMENDTIVVHQLAAHFVLRKGGVVACVYNKRYDPAAGGTHSGTVAPGVIRSVQEGNP